MQCLFNRCCLRMLIFCTLLDRIISRSGMCRIIWNWLIQLNPIGEECWTYSVMRLAINCMESFPIRCRLDYGPRLSNGSILRIIPRKCLWDWRPVNCRIPAFAINKVPRNRNKDYPMKKFTYNINCNNNSNNNNSNSNTNNNNTNNNNYNSKNKWVKKMIFWRKSSNWNKRQNRKRNNSNSNSTNKNKISRNPKCTNWHRVDLRDFQWTHLCLTQAQKKH